MSLSSTADFASRDKLKFVTRAFAWVVLAHFVVWMVSNVLTHSFGWPGAASLYGENASFLSYIQWLAYPLFIGLAVGWVWCSEHVTLRQDAKWISDFNIVLVRWAFFAVLFWYWVIGWLLISGMANPSYPLSDGAWYCMCIALCFLFFYVTVLISFVSAYGFYY